MRSAQANRVIYGQALVELGKRDARIVVLDADVPKSTNTYQFRDVFPDRFFNCGVAEQNMICIAAGLAASGKIPFASTFAVFASMRACEQVRTSVCYPRLDVKIVATNAGVDNAGDGVTHQGIEDLAIMRAMPNLTVLSPSDPVTTRAAVYAMAATQGPVYMRLGRNPSPNIHVEPVEFEIGKMIRLRDGGDLTIIATGNMVQQALLAAENLAARDLQARVLDCHTIKPIDKQAIIDAARQTVGIVTAEDHSIVGGLGSAVCEVVAEYAPTLVRRVGLQDCFAGSGRKYRALLSHFGLDAAAIQARAEELWRLAKVHSRAAH
ncbi:MAG: transketolase family protein [Limisphaerales bacterium]